MTSRGTERSTGPGTRRARCRVAIVGGGPAGCATALELARRGTGDVVVVEAGDYSAVRVGESIPPDTRRHLDRLGVLDAFLAASHAPCYGSTSAWGDRRPGHNDFLFNPLGHGWHLDRGRFDSFLADAARDTGARLLTGTRLEVGHLGGPRADAGGDGERGRGGGGITLKLRRPGGGTTALEADFAVDASGHRAILARALGAGKRYLDRLICANGFFLLPPGREFQHVTLLEAVEYGWWYAARVPGGRVAVAVASDPAILKDRGLSRENPWLEALAATEHIAPALAGAGYQPRSLRAWPAHSFRLDRVVGKGWLAAGDAASAYDPISAQGVFKALGGGIAAGTAVHSHLAGDAEALPTYADTVQRDFQVYTANRGHFYAQERRWPQASFWSRRGSEAGQGPAAA